MRPRNRLVLIVALVVAAVVPGLLLAGTAGAQAPDLAVVDVDTSDAPTVRVTVVVDAGPAGAEPAPAEAEVVEGLTAHAAVAEPGDGPGEWIVTYTSSAAGPTALLVTLAVDGVQATASTEIVLPDRGDGAAAPTSAAAADVDAGPVTTLTVADEGSDLGLYLGAAAVFCALLILAALVLVPTTETLRLAPDRLASETRTIFASVTERVAAATESLVSRRAGFVAAALENGGVAMATGEWIVMVASIAFAGLVVGSLLSGLLPGMVLAGVIVAVAWLWLVRRVDKRRAAFAEQLPEVLQLLASNLRVGHGTVQSLVHVSDELGDPAATELRRVLTEHRLGRDLIDALRAMSERMGNDEFFWVVQAVSINRELGGDLAEVLDNITDTINERNRIRSTIDALSADGRLSAYVLIMLPFFMMAFLQVANPDYLATLFDEPAGRLALAVGGALMVAGWIWIRRIVRLVF